MILLFSVSHHRLPLGILCCLAGAEIYPWRRDCILAAIRDAVKDILVKH